MTELEKITNNLKTRYGEYLTQHEFSEAAGICPKTAYKETKSGRIPYKTVYVGSNRYHHIKAEDVAQYIFGRFKDKQDGSCMPNTRSLEILFYSEPNILSVKEVTLLTGMTDTSVSNWIQKGYLKAFRWKGDYRITKTELIRYIASPHYWKARSNSLQRQAISMSLDWLDAQRDCFSVYGKETGNE